MGTTRLFFLPAEDAPNSRVFFFQAWKGGAQETDRIIARFVKTMDTLCEWLGSGLLCSNPRNGMRCGTQFMAETALLALGIACLEREFAQAISSRRFVIECAAIPEDMLAPARAWACAHNLDLNARPQ